MTSAPFAQTLTLEDAIRLNGPRAFNLTVKPVGSRCNLACRYCYYRDKSDLYGGVEPCMSASMLEKVIREGIAANDVNEVNFLWHGGEPLLAGKDFYRCVLSFQHRYAGGKKINNSLQTNGLLLDEEWTEIFREGAFLIGISLDGPRDLHDSLRRERGDASTFDRVMAAIRLLQRADVPFNILTAVHRASQGRGREVYRFLKSVGGRYLQFLPVVEQIQSGNSRIASPECADSVRAPWCVESIPFGQFLTDVFDDWVRQDVGRIFVGQFDATLAAWCGACPGTCIFAPTCGENPVIEHNGDVYPCDHFVYPQWRLGNIGRQSLRALLCSPVQVRFGIDKRAALPPSCLLCRWRFACNGECPKHRFLFDAPAGFPVNALCEGYSLFYDHIAPAMDRMKQLIASRRSPSHIMDSGEYLSK